MHEVEEKLVEIAVNELQIPPQKILIDEEGEERHVYFYNSRLAKRLLKLISDEDKVFKVRNEFAASYLAGMFDAGGGIGRSGMHIGGLTPADEVMMANLGIHTRGGSIMNLSSFIGLVNGKSILVGLNAAKYQ